MVELMLGASLSFVVILGMSTVAVTIMKSFREGAERVRLQQDTQRVQRIVSMQIRNAADYRIVDPVSPNEPMLEGPVLELLDADGVVIQRLEASDRHLVEISGARLADFELDRLWFVTKGPGHVLVDFALVDKRHNRVRFSVGTSTRN